MADGTATTADTATTFTAGMDTEDPTSICITGLPEGDYVLYQTSVPEGYESIRGPIYFTIQEGTYGFLEDQKRTYVEKKDSYLLHLDISIQNPNYDPRVIPDSEEEAEITEKGNTVLIWILIAEIFVIAVLISRRALSKAKHKHEDKKEQS